MLLRLAFNLALHATLQSAFELLQKISNPPSSHTLGRGVRDIESDQETQLQRRLHVYEKSPRSLYKRSLRGNTPFLQDSYLLRASWDDFALKLCRFLGNSLFKCNVSEQNAWHVYQNLTSTKAVTSTGISVPVIGSFFFSNLYIHMRHVAVKV
jgi:hypothetical protein